MDIYTLIRTDHDKAKTVLERIKSLPDSQHIERLELFGPLKNDLLVHNEAEEESFYVALEEHRETADDAEHSEKEHHEAADLLEYLDDDDLDPTKWILKFDELYTALLHHITKEETKVFAEAHAVLSPTTADELGEIMQNLKQKKMATIDRAAA